MYSINEEELKVIKKQLEREPDNLSDVAKYCPFRRPAILLTSPFEEGQGVFPTIYWLSCPYLVKEVSKLEDRGLISDLTLKLKTDESFYQKMKKAHEIYARRRMNLLGQKKVEIIKKISSDIIKVLKYSGVGGIRDKNGIKCLHTHLADYMINGQNPAGEIVSEFVEWPKECDYNL